MEEEMQEVIDELIYKLRTGQWSGVLPGVDESTPEYEEAMLDLLGKLEVGKLEEIMSAMTEGLRQTLQHCPVCQGDFIKHDYALFSTIPINLAEVRLSDELIAALNACRWEEVYEMQKLAPGEDALEVYIVVCSTGRMAWAMLYHPADFDDNDLVVHCQVIEPEENQRIKEIVAPYRWYALA